MTEPNDPLRPAVRCVWRVRLRVARAPARLAGPQAASEPSELSGFGSVATGRFEVGWWLGTFCWNSRKVFAALLWVN